MSKRILCFYIILIITTLFSVSYATDVVMDLDNTTSNNINQTADNATEIIDNTAYTDSANQNFEQVATTTTTDYDDSTELSISNIINIVLISVGVVLILLGIAIIIKLK